MAGKNKPFLIFIISGEFYLEKLSDELKEVGFKIQTFEKNSLALKFLERSNVQGVFITNHDLEKSKSLVEEIKKTKNSAAIFCAPEHCNPEDTAELLNLGCDEVFLKSCPTIEIMARINAVLRRSRNIHGRQITANISLDTGKFNFHGVTIDPSHLEIIFDEKNRLKLGKKELGIIYYLANNPGVIIRRDNLIHAVWGAHADTRSRSVDQYITKIRISFEKYAQGLNCLRTLHGIGYWYDPKALHKKKVSS